VSNDSPALENGAGAQTTLSRAIKIHFDRFRPGRRRFLQMIGLGSAASSLGLPMFSQAASAGAAAVETAAGSESAITVNMRVNGESRSLTVDPRTTLLDGLRDHLHLTGTKKGCDHGQCGACTVHVNGRRVNACLSLAAMHEGDEVTTIEGVGQPDHLHPMQQAFVEHDGYQCGYCTSGQIMSALAILKEPWGNSDAEIKEAMSGNICRCGAYKNILAAIKQIRKA
jgi:xanthine dehydrogenase YagT iron-sulfur-binding subunit